jgi:hypothetical protein
MFSVENEADDPEVQRLMKEQQTNTQNIAITARG